MALRSFVRTRSGIGPARILLPVAALMLLAACGGAGDATAAGASSDGAAVGTTSPTTSADVASGDVSVEGATTTTTSPPPTAPAAISHTTVTVTEKIPFATRTVKDATLPAGSTKVRTRGVAGAATVTYRVTLSGGTETGRALVSRVVTRKPVTQVTAVGSQAKAQCDPNYSGACVPIASDVDCLGGSGNGPAYVRGPVKVVGTDIYGLDSDGDGIGCE